MSGNSVIPEPVQKFAAGPIAFILGAMLNPLLTSFQNALEALLDAIRLALVGESYWTTEGQKGLADVPLLLSAEVGEAGSKVANPILDTVSTLRIAAIDLADKAGLFEPLVLSIEIAVVLVVLFFAARTTVRVVLDIVPGLGGLL